MANGIKGEVSFEAGGKTYIFVLDTNALADLETRESKPFFKFVNRKEDEWGIREMRSILYSGLQTHHEGITIKQVGQLIDTIGMPKVGAVIGEGLRLAFGEDAKTAENPTTVGVIPFHGIGQG